MDVAEKLGGNAMIALQAEKPAIRINLGPCPVIRTPRLLLRPHSIDDADAIAISLADFSVSRMLTRVPAPFHKQDAVDWLKQQAASKLPEWNFAICDTDGRHLGVVSIELRHGQWHLGYWLNRSAWNRGLMTEAAGRSLKAFFECMPEAEIHSGMFSDNAGSLRVQQKLGFAITGCRDIFCVARNAMVMHIDTVVTARDFVETVRK